MSKDIYDDYDTDDIQEVQRIAKKTRRRRPKNQNAKGNNKRGKKTKKKKSLKQKFFTILGLIVFAYAILILGLVLSTYLNNDKDDDWFSNPASLSPKNVITDVFSGKLPDRTNFAILCTDDDGTRTDTIMVGCYDSVNSALSMISVPRDTVISASAANYETMRLDYPEPGRRTMKINQVHHYGGDKYGVDLAVDELQNLLDIEIDYYVKVDFDAFNYLIDSIGGIEFDVPMNMYYSDPTQDLLINLKAGMQTLDGDQAEQLVRFRSGYANADLGRIAVQQDFLKAFLAQAATADSIKGNPTAYIKTFFKYVKTDIAITDAIKYVGAFQKLDVNNVQTYMLPGRAGYVSGLSGYKVDEDEASTLIYSIFKRPVSEITTELTGEASDSNSEKSYSNSIQVLNGGYTNGMASNISTMLTDKGYKVDSIGTYHGTKVEETRIYVSKSGIGKDLVSLFDDAKVIVDSSETTGYDITVVVGTAQE